MSYDDIMESIFPTTYNINWFIGCYILYYIIHPAMNKIIDSLNKKQLLRVNIFLVVYFYIWQFIKVTTYSNVMGFIILYFIVAYIKKYMVNYRKNVKANLVALVVSTVAFVFSLIILNILALKTPIYMGEMLKMSNIINPFMVMMSISIFNLVINKEFYNKVINYISSMTLLIYIIHGNMYVRNYLISWYYSKIFVLYGYDNIHLIALVTSIFVLIISIILSTIYKETIQKITKMICNYVYKYLKNAENKIEKFLIKID